MAKQKLEAAEQEIIDDLTSKFTYELARKNEKRGRIYDENGNPRGESQFPPRRNLLLRSSILWPGGVDPFSNEKRAKGRYLIRYYDGCSTLFVDNQPKDRETIEQLIRTTRELFFEQGHLTVYAYDVMLVKYMEWASWNIDSPYRVPTAEEIFMLLDAEEARESEAEILDMEEKAGKMAKEASVKHMRVHAKFLNVPQMDHITGDLLSDKSLRVEYRKSAKENPKRFLDTYNDRSIHYKFWIEKALDAGEISTTLIPSKASWGKKGIVICDISGLTSRETILNKLVEFAQLPAGEEFSDMLKTLYD